MGQGKNGRRRNDDRLLFGEGKGGELNTVIAALISGSAVRNEQALLFPPAQGFSGNAKKVGRFLNCDRRVG